MSTDRNEAMSQLPHKLATLIKCLPQAPFRDHLAAECIKQAERVAELESERDQLRAEVERLRAAMTVPTIEPNSQNWQGMDGAIAFHLIERHADSWADAGRMMHEWRDANAARTTHKETE